MLNNICFKELFLSLLKWCLAFCSLLSFSGVATGYIDDSFKFERKSTCRVADQVGQIMITSAPENGDLEDPRFIKLIRERNLGGVILLGGTLRQLGNADAVRRYVRRLKSIAKIPLFMAIDQEGGNIQPLNPNHGIRPYPPHEELGSRFSKKEVFQMARKMGKELKSFGFNWNFAPVVDVNSNQINPIITALQRSFGRDPERVAAYGDRFAAGIKEAGLLSTAKHFPGHGATFKDSHKGTVLVHKTLREMELSDLVPFQKLDNYSSVMTGHISVPAVCGHEPASLSSCFIKNYLKKKMEYKGLVVTDSLSMKAITSIYNMSKVGEKALMAGNDVLLSNYSDIETIMNGLCRSVSRPGNKATLLRKRLAEAYTKVLEAKRDLGMVKLYYPNKNHSKNPY